MIRNRIFLTLAFITALSGCAVSPTYENEGPRSAAQINAQLGLGYLTQKKYKIAMMKLQKALQQDPDLPEAHHYIGELYSQLEQYDKAEVHYKRAIQLDPANSILQNNYGAFLYQQEKFDEALEYFGMAEKDPLYQAPDQLYENIGRCYYRMKNIEDAEKYFRRALELNENLPGSLYVMAQINFDRKNLMGTRAYLQRYRNVARQMPETLWLGIQTERELGDKDAVSSYSLQLKSRFPDSKETKLLMESEK